MTAPGSSFAGPLISGPRASFNNAGTLGPNQGYALLSQTVQLTQNGTSNVSKTMYIPKHSQIVNFYVDTNTAWNSATSAVVSIGTAALDTTYVNSTTVTTAQRLQPTFAAAALLAMQDTGANESVTVSVAPVGATSAGSTFVTMLYRQTLNWDN